MFDTPALHNNAFVITTFPNPKVKCSIFVVVKSTYTLSMARYYLKWSPLVIAFCHSFVMFQTGDESEMFKAKIKS